MTADLQWGSLGTLTPYPISEEARAALTEQGVEGVPEHLTLYLKNATGRERKGFQLRLSKCKTEDDLREMLADLLRSRMEPGFDRRILREVLEDADTTALNQLQYAYVNGVVPDPGNLDRAVERTMARNTPKLLDALARS